MSTKKTKEKYTYHFWVYGQKKTERFSGLNELLRRAISGEHHGELSSEKITRGNKEIWRSWLHGGEIGIFEFARNHGIK